MKKYKLYVGNDSGRTISSDDDKSPEDIFWFGKQIFPNQELVLDEIMSDNTEKRIGTCLDGKITWDEKYKERIGL